MPAGDGLAAEGGQEEREEDEREALLAQEAPHQWCVSPMTVKYVRPVTMTTRYTTNIARMRARTLRARGGPAGAGAAGLRPPRVDPLDSEYSSP